MLNLIKKYGLYVLIAVVSFGAGAFDWVEKTTSVDKTRHKESRTIKERIVEKSNGDKITNRTIKERTDDRRKIKTVKIVKAKQYLAGIAVSRSDYLRGRDTFTLSVSKRVLPDIFIGASVDDSGGMGISLMYAF